MSSKIAENPVSSTPVTVLTDGAEGPRSLGEAASPNRPGSPGPR